MQFASKTPRDLNNDPEPWASPYHDNRADGPGFDEGFLNPRPECDHAQHNEPNPVLVKFRSIPREHRAQWFEGFTVSAERVRFISWSDYEVAHAHRVLTRLERLGGI